LPDWFADDGAESRGHHRERGPDTVSHAKRGRRKLAAETRRRGRREGVMGVALNAGSTAPRKVIVGPALATVSVNAWLAVPDGLVALTVRG